MSADVDSAAFRKVMGSFLTGVTIVTTLDENGALQGLTASSFSSVSLDPPLVLVCVARAARSYPALVRRGSFAVHILAEDQADVARNFAHSRDRKDALTGWRLSEHGLPILDRYHAMLECDLHSEADGGDHAILVGAVRSLSIAPDGAAPLAYYRGELFGLERSSRAWSDPEARAASST